jgi:hypothetical protein
LEPHQVAGQNTIKTNLRSISHRIILRLFDTQIGKDLSNSNDLPSELGVRLINPQITVKKNIACWRRREQQVVVQLLPPRISMTTK